MGVGERGSKWLIEKNSFVIVFVAVVTETVSVCTTGFSPGLVCDEDGRRVEKGAVRVVNKHIHVVQDIIDTETICIFLRCS